MKFEVARQASSPSLCASVWAVPWADEAEQQLSRLALCAASYLQTFAFQSRADRGARHGSPEAMLDV